MNGVMKYSDMITIYYFYSSFGVVYVMGIGSKAFNEGKTKGKHDALNNRESKTISSLRQFYSIAFKIDKSYEDDFYSGYEEGYREGKQNLRALELQSLREFSRKHEKDDLEMKNDK